MPCVRCLSVLKDIRQKRCMRARRTADRYHARSRWDEMVSCLARSGINITKQERRITKELPRETLRERLLPKRPSLIDGLQLV